MERKQVKWHLKELVYEKHDMNFITFCAELNKIGIKIDDSTVWRYMGPTQKTVSFDFLEGAMTVLGCKLSDIMTLEKDETKSL